MTLFSVCGCGLCINWCCLALFFGQLSLANGISGAISLMVRSVAFDLGWQYQ